MNANVKLLKLLIGQSVGFFMIFALALFVPAGTSAWLAGWIFLTLFFVFFLAINLWLFRRNPGLLQERMHLGTSDQPGWDKVLYPLLLIFSLAWLMFMALDAVRFHWSLVPLWIQMVGG